MNCWDSSCVGSFFATIKKEHIDRHAWLSQVVLTKAIKQYIEFYNKHRGYSTLGSWSPIEYELKTASEDFRMAA